MSTPYVGEEPTPDLDEMQQLDEPDAMVRVPVRVVEIGTIQTHEVPSRDAVMRSINVDSNVQQIVGRDLRRKAVKVWAVAATATGSVFIGTDKNEVETGTCAQLVAAVSTGANGSPTILVMNHCLPMWVKNTGPNPVTLSYVAEYWAD
jgi:hypothetical protein